MPIIIDFPDITGKQRPDSVRLTSVALEGWMRSSGAMREFRHFLKQWGDTMLTHMANAIAHDIADSDNVFGLDFKSVGHYFGAEYAKLPWMNIQDFNIRQAERNDAPADIDDWVATVWAVQNICNNVKLGLNQHMSNDSQAYHPVADNVNLIVTPDVVVPDTSDKSRYSFTYLDGVSKTLVELEKADPALAKAKFGRWLHDGFVLFNEIVANYNAHVDSIAFHNTVTPAEKLSVKKVII